MVASAEASIACWHLTGAIRLLFKQYETGLRNERDRKTDSVVRGWADHTIRFITPASSPIEDLLRIGPMTTFNVANQTRLESFKDEVSSLGGLMLDQLLDPEFRIEEAAVKSRLLGTMLKIWQHRIEHDCPGIQFPIDTNWIRHLNEIRPRETTFCDAFTDAVSKFQSAITDPRTTAREVCVTSRGAFFASLLIAFAAPPLWTERHWKFVTDLHEGALQKLQALRSVELIGTVEPRLHLLRRASPQGFASLVREELEDSKD